MKTIPLTQGQVAIVDDEDYEYLMQYKWHFNKSTKGHGYAKRKYMENGIRYVVYMHRIIVKASEHQIVDHINGNTLDNRKENLRICSNAENTRNMKKRSGTSSVFKGVCWYKTYNKWVATIRVNNHGITLGYYDSEVEAAKAYNEAAIKHHGEFAKINNLEDLGVVPLHSPHIHKSKGDDSMEQTENRPVFVTQIGNTTLKIRSILPFMTPEERKQWFKDHEDLPEVKNFYKVWAESLWAIEEQELKKANSHGA